MIGALLEPNFDPRKKIILESAPFPAAGEPVRGTANGTASVTASSTDWLEISAEVSKPELLLITDNYSAGWRAVAEPDSSQRRYALLPADYVLRSIPLAAGKHRLRVEYAPAAFRVGVWISLLAWVCFGAAVLRR